MSDSEVLRLPPAKTSRCNGGLPVNLERAGGGFKEDST